MTCNAGLAASLLVIGITVQGCGEVGDGESIETRQSALGQFGLWLIAPGGAFQEPPALAKGPSGTLAAFGWRSDSQVWVTSQNTSRQWTGTWTQVSNSGGAFTSKPSAVAFDVPSGSLVGRFAIVARRSDNQYYITIRDQNGGGIVQNWSAIPGATFSSSPAITFIPSRSGREPKGTLVLTGRRADNRIWESRNKLGAGDVYFHQAWSAWTQIGTQTFVGSPAISYGCSAGTVGFYSIYVAGRLSDGTFYWNSFDGTSWGTWLVAHDGTFSDGPALASRTTCDVLAETTIFGRGLDNRIWYSTELSAGGGGFFQIPSRRMFGTPTAVGQEYDVYVAANDELQRTLSNTANACCIQ
jgi:hypothetical protein